jgi:hypothetical protein
MGDFVGSLGVTAKVVTQYCTQVNASKFHQNTFPVSEKLIWGSMHIRYTKGWADRQTLSYLLIYYSMEKSPCEANRFPSSQEDPRILWNPKFHYPYTSARRLSLP